MGMTIVEKILARKSGQAMVRPGDLVTVPVDTVVFVDTNFVNTRWREILKLDHPERVVVVLDHRAPAARPQDAAMHRTAREFVARFGIERFHDVGYGQGISHQLVADHAYALPGTILLNSDSHTGSGGVFNCLARGVGVPDLVYAATKGETWFYVTDTVRYELTGALQTGVTMKDAFLYVADEYGEHAGLNVEYGGPALPGLTISARKTLTTMSTELSAEFAVFDPDDVMVDYLRSRTAAPFECVRADADAKYRDVRTIDLPALQPLVAFPDAVIENSQPVSAAAGTRIDQAYVGSCANGTLEDLQLVAQVLKGRRVDPRVRLVVTPGSQNIYREAAASGLLAQLVEAGAVVTAATCGACGGGHAGVLGANETCITASTRNFKGRMGDMSARIFMGSPATVAASAVKGVIADPRELLN
ncbi:MAG TPA: aconitase/3-isopropylmalate dehydratase large subunit family protein [Burkholderiales bacterium]|nr:aconitase/3-isopropylmalate dehydratase large subunit family protein [Burkholderiales bacterium]